VSCRRSCQGGQCGAECWRKEWDSNLTRFPRPIVLSTASLGALGYEHNLSRPVIRLWNDDHHVAA
jgi:hypothetical protein